MDILQLSMKEMCDSFHAPNGEANLSPTESMAMFRYLMYKKKLYNTESKRIPKIAPNFSQNSPPLP